MDTRDGRLYSSEQIAILGEDDKKYMRQLKDYPTPIQRARGRVGRNDPCPCRSGKKFKKCCLRKPV